MDTLANSDVSTTSHRVGLSTVGDWGYVGMSYSDLSSTYGILFTPRRHMTTTAMSMGMSMPRAITMRIMMTMNITTRKRIMMSTAVSGFSRKPNQRLLRLAVRSTPLSGF